MGKRLVKQKQITPRTAIYIFSFFLICIQSPWSEASVPLTWTQALAETARNNSDLRAAQASFEATRFQIQGAKSIFLPQLTAGLNSSYGSIGGNFSFIGNDNNRAFFSATITLSQNLFNGLTSFALVRQSEANSQISAANLQIIRARVSLDLKTAYAGLRYAQAYSKLTQEFVRIRMENLKMVELRFENGSENKGSYLLSKAYLKQAEFEHLQAEDLKAVSRKQLAQVLGRDHNENTNSEEEEIELTEDIPSNLPPANIEFKNLAIQTPDHLQAINQEDSAGAAVTIARAPFFPTLNLVASGSKTGDVFFPSRDGWSVGLNISLPFFTGGRDYYGLKAAAENLGAAMFNRTSVDRNLLTKLKMAWTVFYEAIQKVQVDRSFLEATTVREKIGRNKYNNGLLTFEAWDIIENDFISRQRIALQSQRDRTLAEAAWEQAQGKWALP